MSGAEASLEQAGRGAQWQATAAALVAVAALVAGLVAAPPWSPDDGLPAGSAARVTAGTVEYLDQDAWRAVGVGGLLPRGATVRAAGGEAGVATESANLRLADTTRLRLDAPIRVERGAMLIDGRGDGRGGNSDRGSEPAVALGALVASGSGAWRVDADTVRRIAVYSGRVSVGANGTEGVPVGRLGQADLSAGQLPSRALPLRYDLDDDWDRRRLRGVIATDAQARRLTRSLRARFGDRPRGAGYFSGVATGVGSGVLVTLDTAAGAAVGRPAEVLLGVAAAHALRDNTQLGTAQAATRVRELRRDGATWGIVLGRHGVGARELRAAVDGMLTTSVVAGGGPPATDSPAVAAEQPGGPAVSADTDDDVGESDAEPVQQAPSPQPSGEASQTPGPEPCQLAACEPVNETGDELIDRLDEVVPGAGEQVEDAVSEIPTIPPPG